MTDNVLEDAIRSSRQAGYQDALNNLGQYCSGPILNVNAYLEGYQCGQDRKDLRLAGERARLHRYNVESGRPTED